MRNNCSICGAMLVEPAGRESSDVLLVGEYPGEAEMQMGIPFVGDTGKLLEYELMRAGLDINTCRMTNLWQHYKSKDEGCLNYMVRSLTLEMAGRKVLFMGSDLLLLFLNDKVSDWAGLEIKSPLFPKSTQWVMCAPNPGYALHATIGEVRLSLQKFVKNVRRLNE